MKYYRARQSYCWYTDNWHLYLFANRYSTKTHVGWTVKHRIGGIKRPDEVVWRHISFKVEHRPRFADAWMGRLEFNLQTHKSYGFNHSRILRSKKYIRFAICF